MIMKSLIQKKGFAIVEMLIYVGITALVITLMCYLIVSITNSSGPIKLNKDLAVNADNTIGRMMLEIRNAASIDTGSSVLDATPGTLKLNTADSSEAATTIEFYLQNDAIMAKEGTGVGVSLMATGTKALSLIFRRISTGRSEGVKIETQLETTVRQRVKKEHFFGTAVIRGSYQN